MKQASIADEDGNGVSQLELAYLPNQEAIMLTAVENN